MSYKIPEKPVGETLLPPTGADAPGSGIERAIAYATALHGGQTDKAGRAYILHPLRVMVGLGARASDERLIAAVLHDVVEDCNVTLEDLLRDGFPAASVAAIDALSRRESETYGGYILRLKDDPIAVEVKIADLQDNLDPARPSTSKLTSGTREKYRDALRLLTGTRDGL